MRLILQSLALLMLLGLSPSAFAQLRERTPEVFPAHPSDRDVRYVILRDSCGEIRFEDPARLRPDGQGGWVLELRQTPEVLLCFPVPPSFSTTVHAFRLPTSLSGRLVVNLASFERPLESFKLAFVDTPIPPSVTGTWHDPTMPGQGITLNYAEGKRIDVHWATYEPDGTPLWLVGTSRFTFLEPHRRTASLFALRDGAFPGTGTTTPSATEWGRLSLEYLGCGRLQASWEANDEARYPAATRQLEQFSGEATNLCDLNRFAQSQFRRVRHYGVQVEHSP